MEKDPVQADFRKTFYRLSLEIRPKYYFRTKDNPLYRRKLNGISALKMADIIDDVTSPLIISKSFKE